MRLTRHAGVTLVEVLTAVLVLALGVVGAAGLQWQALRAAHEAALRSTATRIAGDFAERMRAHQQWLQQRGGDYPILGFAHDAAAPSPGLPAVGPSCYSGPCSPAQLAAHDLHELVRQVEATLPQGRVRICRDATPWDEAQQTLVWDCDEAVAGRPAPVVIKLGWRSRRAASDEVLPAIALLVHS